MQVVKGFIYTLVAVFLGLGVAEAQQPPTVLGTFDAWVAYVVESGSGRECLVSASPAKSSPKVRRGDVVFHVSHRPQEGVRYEVSVRAGYVYKDTSRPFVQIGDERFQLRTGISYGLGGESRSWAWMEDAAEHERFAAALRGGETMILKGTSSRGTLTTDTYALKGAAAALEAIDGACL